ncbi:unnamed protein product [Toxocara canis]|uniref:SHSP domain-containing protein n=1 Tax=Toxocara canis TaxID=6265 RepID=A0A183U536_TOXCA|nr:unnamed protein product [Toxocara canis]
MDKQRLFGPKGPRLCDCLERGLSFLLQIQAPTVVCAPQFGSASETVSTHQGSEDSFCATIDVSQFKPDDLKVAVIGQFIVVEANHPEREDELGFVERHFTRKFRLPRNVPAEAVTSNLTADGHLTVTAIAPKPKEDSTARTIPIKMVPKSEGSEISSQNNA